MRKYERPKLSVELFMTEEILTNSTIDTKAKLAVPKGKESTFEMLKS